MAANAFGFRWAGSRSGSRSAAHATAKPSVGSDLPLLRLETRDCAISFDGTVAVLAEQTSGTLSGDDGVHRVAGRVDHVVVLAQ